MRPFGSAIALMALAFQLSACSPDSATYFRQGIGASLAWDGLANSTQLQNTYIGAICDQAGLGRSPKDVAACQDSGFGPREWGLFVQAGMNDIDLRCDSYLAWLDARRRSSEPTLKQIAAAAATTVGIMGIAGSSPEAISIVGQAFGLASDTFTNINSRLLLSVEQSTVQSIVLKRRQEYRFNVNTVLVDNRPAAIHALRSYLNICMPFTIEMEINTTITAFERGGSRALDGPRLITHHTVGPAKILLRPSTPRETPRGDKGRPQHPRMEGYERVFLNYEPNRHTPPVLQDIQGALCVPPGEARTAGPLTLGHIAIYRQTRRLALDPLPLNEAQTKEIRDKGPCIAGSGQNYFERQTFSSFKGQPQQEPMAALIRRLRNLPQTPAISDTATLESTDLREAIAKARQQLKVADPILQRVPEALRKHFESQITRDLHIALIGLDK